MSNGIRFERIYSGGELVHKSQPDFKHEVLEYIFYFLRVFLTVAVIYIVIQLYVFDVIGVKGLSMFPYFASDDVVYVDKITANFSDFRRGEIVVVKPPNGYFEREGKLYIKRIVGLPGESVEFIDGSVYVYNPNYPQGEKLVEKEYLDKSIKTYKNIKIDNGPYTENKFGEDEYYVLGDNRLESIDSRVFGAVPKNRIVGRVIYRSGNTSGFFALPQYNIGN